MGHKFSWAEWSGESFEDSVFPQNSWDNPEEGKGCSEGVILRFMPFKQIKFKPILTQLRNIKQNNSACNPSVVE